VSLTFSPHYICKLVSHLNYWRSTIHHLYFNCSRKICGRFEAPLCTCGWWMHRRRTGELLPTSLKAHFNILPTMIGRIHSCPPRSSKCLQAAQQRAEEERTVLSAQRILKSV